MEVTQHRPTLLRFVLFFHAGACQPETRGRVCFASDGLEVFLNILFTYDGKPEEDCFTLCFLCGKHDLLCGKIGTEIDRTESACGGQHRCGQQGHCMLL